MSSISETDIAAPSVSARSRYLQLALIVIAAGAIYPILYLRQSYQTTMLEVLKLSNTELGVLYSILGTSFLVGYLPSGWLADRVQPRILILISMVGTGLLGLWYATLPGYSSLLVIYCGFGVTTGLTFWAATLKQVNLIAGANEQGRFFGILDGGRGLVEALLASVAIALFVFTTETRGAGLAMGFRDVVLLYAVFCIVVGIAYFAVSQPVAVDKSPRKREGNLLADIKTLLRIPEVWLVAAMAEVARATSIPISTGERLTTKYEFQRVLELKAASILQMNVARVGGLLEAKKIAGMAEAYYAQIAPHLYNGPVGAAASIQLSAATPNFLIHEAILDFSGFHADVLKTKLAVEDGYIIPSREPGLGIELNMDVVEKHTPYTGERLHLQMDSRPADVKAFAPARG